MLWSSFGTVWDWIKWAHGLSNQLASSYANVPQQLASSPSTVGFITRDFHALISRQHSQTNRRSLHTLFLTSKSQCMQKIRSVDALLTTQNVLSWSGRFGGGHTGWSQLQLASSVSPLWFTVNHQPLLIILFVVCTVFVQVGFHNINKGGLCTLQLDGNRCSSP